MATEVKPSTRPPQPGTVLGDPRSAVFSQAFMAELLNQGHLEHSACERALLAQSQTGQRIDTILTELGLISEPILLEALGKCCQLEIVGADRFPSQPVLEDILSVEFLRRSLIIPLADSPTGLIVACADPFNTDILTAIAYFVGKPVTSTLATARTIEAAFGRIYGNDEPIPADTINRVLTDSFVNEDDVQRLRDIASEAPIVRFVSRVISSAVAQRASDIHIEPMVDCVRVRFRVDGLMAEVERLPPGMQSGIASRIKIMAKLNIAERRLPQDGRIKVVVGGREIDLRVSTTSVLHGESIVLRILDQDQVELSFDALGFDQHTTAAIMGLLRAPHGIILVTGPTGSGKTTTLYSALKVLNSIERKVFTVEDPIEYQLSGVNQMQIKPSIGLDFVHCLRSILRQDPDVIMVGEMRDVETARIGIQASLTGHLVLSTLHTNSAAASIIRLLDMGLEDYLLASTVSGVLAQRLVRKLCVSCSVADRLSGAEQDYLLQHVAVTHQHTQTENVRTAIGCAACNYTGFRGRTSIAELLLIDDAVRLRIKHGSTDRDVMASNRGVGMETLYQNGLRKVLSGETTVEELHRVTQS